MRELPAYLLFRLLSGLFGALPEPAMRRAGEMAGYLASFAAPGRMRMAERHMRRVAGPEADARALARRVFASYGRYWAETFWVRPRRLAAILDHVEVEGLRRVYEAADLGKGIVFTVAHLGNWEVCGLRAAQEGFGVTAVAEELPNRRITEWFVGVRAVFGIDILVARRGVTAELEKRLLQKAFVALPSDRDLTGRGIAVTLFGEETTLPAGPFILSERTGAPIQAVASYFRQGRGHLFVPQPYLELPESGTRSERLAAGAQLLADQFEDMIRAEPTQWHLLQPNWPSDRTIGGRR